MKLCPGIWCPSTIFLATLSFLFLLFFGYSLISLSLYWLFNITVHDSQTDDIRWSKHEYEFVEVDAIPGDVTPIKADHIDESNEGKLVYLTGNTTTDYLAADPLFGVVVSDVIKLKRVVEKFEGQDKGWSNTSSPLNSETFMPKQVKLGAFTLSYRLIDKMSHFQHLPMTLELFEQIPDHLSVQLGGKLHLNNDNYYVGQYPDNPQFGDLRIRFSVISAEAVSVIAKQVGSHLSSYKTQTDHDIELLKSGVASMEKVISTHSKKIIPVKTYYFSQFYKRLPLYFSIFFTLSFGIYLIFLMLKVLNNFPPAWTLKKSLLIKSKSLSLRIIKTDSFHIVYILLVPLFIPLVILLIVLFFQLVFLLGIYPIILLLSKLLKYIPFFDNFINLLNWLFALIISVSLFLIIIASIWISYLPMLGISLIVIAVGNLYFLKPAHRLLTVSKFEPPEEPTLVQETIVPKKEYSMPLS